MVEKGSEEVVTGLASKHLKSVPELLGVVPLQKLELLVLVDLLDNISIFVLQFPKAKLLVERLPCFLKQGDKLVLNFGDTVDENFMSQNSFVEFAGHSSEFDA